MARRTYIECIQESHRELFARRSAWIAKRGSTRLSAAQITHQKVVKKMNGMIQTTIVASVGAAAMLAQPLTAHGCSSSDLAALRIELEVLASEQRSLEVLECIKAQSAEIPTFARKSGNDNDIALYAIAQLGSNAIQELGQPLYNQTAAKWWSGYLENVGQPYDWSRMNFAVLKLTQHARFDNLQDFSETIFTAIGKIGAKLRPEVSFFLVDNLYRCPAWNTPVPASAAKVCGSTCRPLLQDFLKAMGAARESDKGRPKIKGRSLSVDLDLLQERLKCHG